MARMIEKYTGVTAGAEPIGGGAANLNALHNGQIEFSSIVTYDGYDAPRGPGQYKETGPISITALFNEHHFLLTGVVRDDSGLRTVEDWRGKRLMSDNKRSALALNATKGILDAYGITTDDVVIQPQPGTSDRIIAKSW